MSAPSLNVVYGKHLCDFFVLLGETSPYFDTLTSFAKAKKSYADKSKLSMPRCGFLTIVPIYAKVSLKHKIKFPSKMSAPSLNVVYGKHLCDFFV
jgi:hypothetical protein